MIKSILTPKSIDGFQNVISRRWRVSHGKTDVVFGGKTFIYRVMFAVKRQQTSSLELPDGICPGLRRSIRQPTVQIWRYFVQLKKEKLVG